MTNTAPKLQIRVFDDSTERGETWAAHIRDACGAHRVDAIAVGLDEFAQLFDELADASAGGSEQALSVLADVDVLVVDSDINYQGGDREGARAHLRGRTGRHFASLARFIAGVPLTLVVNAGGARPTFHFDSQADLTAGGDEIVDGGSLARSEFWSGVPFGHAADYTDSFAPTTWSGALRIAADRSLVELLSPDERIDSAILGDELCERIGTFQRDTLTDDSGDFVTLRQFAKAGLEQAFPQSRIDYEDAMAIRVALGQLSRWVRHALVPSASVVVDAYHLPLAGQTILAAAGAIEVDDVNAFIEDQRRLGATTSQGDASRVGGPLEQLYGGPLWTPWKSDVDSAEVARALRALRLAEDVSSLISLDDAQQYTSDFGAPAAIRYVRLERPPLVRYVPRSRLG